MGFRPSFDMVMLVVEACRVTFDSNLRSLSKALERVSVQKLT